ncbi:alpha/beta hydrolase [Clostridioides mangenotii]|uniref:alpha/beta fold hydrolase n=1 Tax=Metaclostridioides mangenotii TaxID=1540 RepID=UPI002149D453|nr:alpha/beta hydrolase [Clostridioides mangenotii]MCR1955965.1 alpha/beta hydrolase [Clostridioides mangenotii]
MKKLLSKVGKIILLAIGIIIIFLIICMLIGFTLHKTYYKSQLESIKPYGEMVNVDNKNMHVYSMGEGENTIVLLPGHGVPLPSADFAPLMRELSKENRVVTVEYFGVGFSDKTDKPRTNENYMNEIRTSLNKAGIKPPYILMPHSISGIYSEYYATKHPEEVKGIILLDSTSTALTSKVFPKDIVSTYKAAKFQQEISLQRLLLSFISDETLEKNGYSINNGYTQKEIDDIKKYMNYSMNNTIIEQLENTFTSVQEVKDLPIPESVPILKIIASENNDKRQEEHLKRLGNNASSVVLDGTHFIYHNQTEKISKLTDQFIDKLN